MSKKKQAMSQPNRQTPGEAEGLDVPTKKRKEDAKKTLYIKRV